MSKAAPAAKPGTQQKTASDLQQKSPAEFFAENKNIAGFDNVSKVTLISRPMLIS